jgi:hypothetical protein
MKDYLIFIKKLNHDYSHAYYNFHKNEIMFIIKFIFLVEKIQHDFQFINKMLNKLNKKYEIIFEILNNENGFIWKCHSIKHWLFESHNFEKLIIKSK